MYSACIFCSAALGRNEAIEAFPVGRALAFDGWTGRLWVVCPKCARWNLSPIEERWEAVEEAEKRFVDSRLRVHSENIGLAKLPDGTRLIRVGQALPGELAAWRYGSQLVRRRRQYLWGVAGAVGVSAAAMGGLAAAGVVGMAGSFVSIGRTAWEHRQSKRLIYRLGAAESPTGEALWLRRYHLHGARVAQAEGGAVELVLPEARIPPRGQEKDPDAWRLVLQGPVAEAVLGRAMVVANRAGGRAADVDGAVGLLERAGGAEAYLEGLIERRAILGIPRLSYSGQRSNEPGFDARSRWRHFVGTFRGEPVPYRRIGADELWAMQKKGPPHAKQLAAEEKRAKLARPQALALEMALHEEAERRALRGELTLLESAWREAEEIARIADALPDDPLLALRRE